MFKYMLDDDEDSDLENSDEDDDEWEEQFERQKISTAYLTSPTRRGKTATEIQRRRVTAQFEFMTTLAFIA